MITEGIIVDVVRAIRGQRWTSTHTIDPGGDRPRNQETTEEDAMPPGQLRRALLSKYAMADINAAVEWLEVGEYVSYSGWGLIVPRALVHLTARGVSLACTGELPESERALVYQDDPYAVFVARQFAVTDDGLFEYLRTEVLTPLGIKVFDGKVDGVEGFRGEILRKIRRARYFVCVLTHREQLVGGGFASSVWLYQEVGAAVALGKRPLVLVEEGISEHYAGELQKNYEYIPFTRQTFQTAFAEVSRRIQADLMASNIPQPRVSNREDG